MQVENKPSNDSYVEYGVNFCLEETDISNDRMLKTIGGLTKA